MLEDALFRIGRVRLGAQDLQLLGAHGQGQVGKQRAVEIIDQLLVAHVVVVGEAQRRAALALGLDYRLANVVGAAAILLGIDAPGLGRLIQARRHIAADVIAAGGGLMAHHPHRIVARRIHLEQGAGQAVVDEGGNLGVHRGQVVALVEIVADDLPVEIAIGRQIQHPHPVFGAIALQPLRERREPFVQRRNIVVHAPEHKRAPGVAAQLGQLDLAAGIAAGKILRVLHVHQRAIGVELPAMIAAGDARRAAHVAQNQPVSAMRAGVVEGLDGTGPGLIGGLTDHDHRFLAEIVADEITLFFQLGQNPAQMPHLGPEVLVLQLHPLARDVAIGGDRITAHGHIKLGGIAGALLLGSHFSILHLRCLTALPTLSPAPACQNRGRKQEGFARNCRLALSWAGLLRPAHGNPASAPLPLAIVTGRQAGQNTLAVARPSAPRLFPAPSRWDSLPGAEAGRKRQHGRRRPPGPADRAGRINASSTTGENHGECCDCRRRARDRL